MIDFEHEIDHGENIYGDTSWIEDDCPDTAAAQCDEFSLVDSVET